MVCEEPFGLRLLLHWVLVPEVAGVAMQRRAVEAYGRAVVILSHVQKGKWWRGPRP